MSNENKRRKTPQSSSCLNNFFPTAKRLRSATRRILFEDKTNVASSISISPISQQRNIDARRGLTNVRREDVYIFKDVPVEISQRIFDFMDLKSLSQLSLADQKCRELVQEYIKSKHFNLRFRRSLRNELDAERRISINEFLIRAAVVFKRATMILPTFERISCAQSFFYVSNESDFANQEIAQRWGIFWHRFMRGWEFLECTKTFKCLVTYGKNSIEKMLTSFFNSKPGKWHENEYRLRVFFRWFILDYAFEKDEDLGYWLTTSLGDHTMYHQAKLLYLIFGPVNALTRRIEWDKMTQVGITWRMAENVFKKLNESFHALQKHAPPKWTDDTIISLIEELTSFPDGWLLENFGYLLLYCEERITHGILLSRAINGRLDEVCFIFHSMCLCVSRSSRNMAFMFRLFCRLFAEIPNEASRLQLVRSFARQTSDKLSELYGNVDNNNNNGISAYEKFFGMVLLMAVRNNALNPED